MTAGHIRHFVVALIALLAAGCGDSSGEQAAKSPTAKPSSMKQSRVERVESELARHLEDEHREYLDKGAKTFCEVDVVGIGREGAVPAIEPSFGPNGGDTPIQGTPVYTYHWCEDYRPKGEKLQSMSGGTYPIRFVVAGIDSDKFRVVDQREPVDGAGNAESLRALFPDPYFDQVRDHGDNRRAYLGCAAVTEARKHFDLPDAKVVDGSDACDLPS